LLKRKNRGMATNEVVLKLKYAHHIHGDFLYYAPRKKIKQSNTLAHGD